GTGRHRWSVSTRKRVESSPVIVGGRAYVGTGDGILYGLDLAAGRKAWQFRAGAELTASPAIAGNRLVIGAQDGAVYCFGQR
ncbi:MAG TPA: PQQ-binding-like beta-propeller repeat protein, partial [Armatimonadota bacterium]|nr:PQQ-binding-like beta-propeller repeat protein [Armatimonadota bacterium]